MNSFMTFLAIFYIIGGQHNINQINSGRAALEFNLAPATESSELSQFRQS